ncbi:MAG: AAA family ATPase, partial [Desulfovibrionaceae bacterium]|nr:AAA family ATPase [Desulfovibrionaceae bacterium]
MPAHKMLPHGCQHFRRIVEDGMRYVDKTALIERLLAPDRERITVLMRPRRFGKSLTLSMLAEFFDCTLDSRKLFEGLAVSRNAGLCAVWMNRRPVLHLDLSNVCGLIFEDALAALRRSICDQVAFRHRGLLDSPALSADLKARLRALADREEDDDLLAGSLATLCRALHGHRGHRPILLVDECDTPQHEAGEWGYAPDMTAFLRRFFAEAYAGPDAPELAVFAGCLNIADVLPAGPGAGIGPGIAGCGVWTPDLADSIGFTQEEADMLLEEAGCAEKREAVREWYGGYSFGQGQTMYCPWEIINYIDDLRSSPELLPKAYWAWTASRSLMDELVSADDAAVTGPMTALLAGEAVRFRLEPGLCHDTAYDSVEHVWNLLLYAGCLTLSEGPDAAGLVRCVLPHRSVANIFRDAARSWYRNFPRDRKERARHLALHAALRAGDGSAFTKCFSWYLARGLLYLPGLEDLLGEVLKSLFREGGRDVAFGRKKAGGRKHQDRADGMRLLLAIEGDAETPAQVLAVRLCPGPESLAAETRKALRSASKTALFRKMRQTWGRARCWGLALHGTQCLALAGEVE